MPQKSSGIIRGTHQTLLDELHTRLKQRNSFVEKDDDKEAIASKDQYLVAHHSQDDQSHLLEKPVRVALDIDTRPAKALSPVLVRASPVLSPSLKESAHPTMHKKLKSVCQCD